jgi:hypothetical protein
LIVEAKFIALSNVVQDVCRKNKQKMKSKVAIFNLNVSIITLNKNSPKIPIKRQIIAKWI